jgi:hypothetical protein
MSHEHDTPPTPETHYELFVSKDHIQNLIYHAVRTSSEWANSLNEKDIIANPDLLSNLKDDVQILSKIYKMIFKQRKLPPKSEREAVMLDTGISTGLENFSLLHNITEAQVIREVPLADSTNLSSQLHELANSVGGILTVASFPVPEARDVLVPKNIRAVKAMCRRIYTRIGPEPLPATAIPFDFPKLHEEILTQSAIKTKEIELISKSEEFLEKNKELLILLDPSDLPGFMMNIIQNLRRHYNVRDALAEAAKKTRDPNYIDREKEPRILEVRYAFENIEGQDYLNWIIIDHATGFPTRILQEQQFPPGFTTVPEQGGQGLGMSYYQKRFSEVGILFGFGDEIYEYKGIKRRGSRLTVKIPVFKH